MKVISINGCIGLFAGMGTGAVIIIIAVIIVAIVYKKYLNKQSSSSSYTPSLGLHRLE